MSSRGKTITIGANEADQRLDRFLRKLLKNVPLSDIYRMIRKKEVKVNGRKAKESQMLIEGDIIYIDILYDEPSNKAVPEADCGFGIVFEDENIMVVDKPPGLIMHPDISHKGNTLVDQVIYYLYKSKAYDPEKESTFAPAAVNRLDLNTGGLVMFAKSYSALQVLSEMVRDRKIQKRYICVVKGDIKKEREIRAYLSKDEAANKVRITENSVPGSKEIHTRIMPLKSGNGWALLEIDLLTGRSHQIRAQLAALGHPIIGDVKYGAAVDNRHFKDHFGLKNQLLYAYKLTFKEGEGVLSYLQGKEFKADLPKVYEIIISSLFD